MRRLDPRVEVDADRLSFAITRRINRDLALNASVNFTKALDLLSDDLIVSARFYIECLLLDEVVVKYPEDWRQAIKERWFPKWATKRWPVRYASVKIVATTYDERVGALLANRGYSTKIIVTNIADEGHIQ